MCEAARAVMLGRVGFVEEEEEEVPFYQLGLKTEEPRISSRSESPEH